MPDALNTVNVELSVTATTKDIVNIYHARIVKRSQGRRSLEIRKRR